jgi:hypothetical protein
MLRGEEHLGEGGHLDWSNMLGAGELDSDGEPARLDTAHGQRTANVHQEGTQVTHHVSYLGNMERKEQQSLQKELQVRATAGQYHTR